MSNPKKEAMEHLMVLMFVNGLRVILDARAGVGDQAVVGLDCAYCRMAEKVGDIGGGHHERVLVGWPWPRHDCPPRDQHQGQAAWRVRFCLQMSH